MKFILFLITVSVFSISKTNYQDRKKNFDQKLSQLEQIDDNSISSNIEDLKKRKIEIESYSRSSEKEKLNSSLIEAEKQITETQINLISILKNKSKMQMDSYSSEISKISEKERIEKKVLTVDEKTKREKSSSYISLARVDFQNSLKYERDKNYFYSIQLLKKSLDYVSLASKTIENKDEVKKEEPKKEENKN